jgi:hypothetical protein
VPAGDKWDFEGKPTYNGAPAEESSGFTTLSQVLALLDGATVGTFDEVDSFKFAGDGTAVNFDLTGITKTGLTADAVLVQVNGIMQDPDVFSPSHTPKGAIGGSPNSRWKKITLNYTDFKSGSSYSPVISGGGFVSTITLHTLDAGEYIGSYAWDLVTQFNAVATAFDMYLQRGVAGALVAYEGGGTNYSLASASDPQMEFAIHSAGGMHVGPSITPGDGFIELKATFGVLASSLTSGQITIWIEIIAPENNIVTSVASSGAGINNNKYTLSYVGGTPRITFNTAPANGDVIVVRVLSGTFQGYIGDGSVGTDQLADDSVTAAKINVGAGSANRILVFDASGDGTAQVPTASLVSDFNTAVRTNRLDQMAVPTGSVSLNNQKITSLAVGTDSADAVTKGQLDAVAASTGITIARSLHNIGSVSSSTPIAIAYPSGFSTYPKMVFVRLMSASSLAYGATSGFSTESNAFYTDGGTVDPRALDLTDYSNGNSKATVQIEVTGTTTGISIKRNNTALTWAEVTWIK